MSAPYVRPYFDSGVFISWLLPTDQGPLADGTEGDRHPVSVHVLQAAESGEYQAVTSHFTLAEVFKKRGYDALNDQQNGSLLKYFDNDWIAWVSVDRLVGEEANRLLVRYRDNRLRPADAVHLASALRAKCDVLLTWDGPFASINHPDIRIEFPRIGVGTLFESAR